MDILSKVIVFLNNPIFQIVGKGGGLIASIAPIVKLAEVVRAFLIKTFTHPGGVPPKIKPNNSPTFQKLLIISIFLLAIDALLFLVTLLGNTHVTAPMNASVPTMTVIPSPSATLLPYKYDFESGIQGWTTSEKALKLATTAITTQYAKSGKQSLIVTTQLFGDTSQAYADAATPSNGEKTVYLHTEATVYFDPIDLSGKTISCYLYLPAGLVNIPHETYVRLFAKDASFLSDFSQAVNIADDNTAGNWYPISFTIGASNADQGFNPHVIKEFGVRIETPHGSTLNYTGNYYIDACNI